MAGCRSALLLVPLLPLAVGGAAPCAAADVELCPRPPSDSAREWPRNDASSTDNKGAWKVLMMRHAESVASTMDPEFVASCTTGRGFAGCNHSYDPMDSPLSSAGIDTVRQQGRSQALASLRPPDVIFISPMLRTIQTAMNAVPPAWLQSEVPRLKLCAETS